MQTALSIGKSPRAMTLTELLVVLAILLALTGGIVPATVAFLTRGESDNVQATLVDSWNLALAEAQGNSSPVCWQLDWVSDSARIRLLDSRGLPFWQRAFKVSGLNIPGNASTGNQVRMIVYPHGLSAPIQVSWSKGQATQYLTLPPDHLGGKEQP